MAALPAGPGAAKRLVPFVAVSACVHLLMLTLPITASRPGGGGPAPSRLEVRLEAPATPRVAPVSPLPATPVRPLQEPPLAPEPAEHAELPPPLPQEQVASVVPDAGRGLADDQMAIAVPQIADPEYLPSRLLDVYPKPMAEVPMVYPDAAASGDMSGRVTLLLLIDELGSVVEASVVEADPAGYFEEAAVDTFRGVLFSPGIRDGRPVKSRLVVEVAFEARTGSARGH